MNKTQETRLKIDVANLSRMEEGGELQDKEATQKRIKETVAKIYQNKTDIITVLQVEQILNKGYANVVGNSVAANKRMEELVGKSTVGLEAYEAFSKAPKNYVKYTDLANKNIGRSKGEGLRHYDEIPIEPVRAAFIQFRKQLTTELSQAKVKQFSEEAQTNKMRFDATIKAERLYLEQYVANRVNEPEQNKQKHLQDFDKRMERLTKKIEPSQREKQQEPQQKSPERQENQKEKQQDRQQEKQREEPKREEKQSKRSKGLGLSRWHNESKLNRGS